MSPTRSAPTTEEGAYHWTAGTGPLVAAALHHGHFVRPEIEQYLALSESERLREEDPFTGNWTDVGDTRIVGLRSRFEVDLNRPREQAVYLRPEDAWGLRVWREPPPPEVIDRSLAHHDAFYDQARREFEALRKRHGRFVVFDLHSYNHRRAGAGNPPDDPTKNPEVNLGTGSMDRPRWGRIVERVIDELRSFEFLGRDLDVRENVRFRGGYFPRWVHGNFPDSGCALAIEFKKFFMDEWTGDPDPQRICAIGAALRHTAAGVMDELSRR